MTLEGPLNKWTNHFHGWQYRYFVLDMNKGLLSYYLLKEHVQKGDLRGCIKLNEAFVGYDKDDDILFTITVGDKTFHLQASNLADKEKWVNRIEKAIILSHSNPKAIEARLLEDSRISQEEMIASADKFETIITELDAYLQLLIEQNKHLETKYERFSSSDENIVVNSEKTISIEEISSNDTETDKSNSRQTPSPLQELPPQTAADTSEMVDQERTNIEKMLSSTKSLIETIKHSIVCLQIAKVNNDPRNGLHTNNDLEQVLTFFNSNTKDLIDAKNKPLTPEPDDSSATSSNTSSTNQLTQKSILDAKPKSSILGIPLNTFTTSDDDESKSDLSDGRPFKVKKPGVDKSAGEDEDTGEQFRNFGTTSEDNESFYDAVSSGSDTEIGGVPDIKVMTVDNNLKSTESLITEDFKKQSIDDSRSQDIDMISSASNKVVSEDEEDEFDEEELDMNSQSSVITHLLTQVRIGMDLTKITLPTFILETRSLLEMYADFFAVTELFLKIPEIKCPHERMIQVARWYMSTFRAGRKSPVAKKPYNPILGELFQCWYNLPNLSNSTKKRTIEDGPVPWATSDQLTFIAEQVSHHPPISAFYAEHHDKRVQLEGYTYTKSSFLGLSIAVHMIGEAVLSLIDLEEEYVMTFPSAYGRSILGVPWFEMGGQVQIECVKTGYQAAIQFLTKPFYGGKKHQITGSICGPDKKVLNTIEGDWNGTMLLKTGKKIEILINTQSMSMIRKQTRKLKDQCEKESRRIWKDVTYSLRTKQLELATANKQQIEQRQRDELKVRKENNLVYQTKYFQEVDGNWAYKNPLKKRLIQEK